MFCLYHFRAKIHGVIIARNYMIARNYLIACNYKIAQFCKKLLAIACHYKIARYCTKLHRVALIDTQFRGRSQFTFTI